jgi:hypothetical protein
MKYLNLAKNRKTINHFHVFANFEFKSVDNKRITVLYTLFKFVEAVYVFSCWKKILQNFNESTVSLVLNTGSN